MQPIVLSTWSFGPVANNPAWEVLVRRGDEGGGGGGVLDAVIAGATAVENDPTINSVGIGGLPDASGRVSLDGCVMENPDRAGAVACLRRFANPCAIARRVMEKTIHIMLVGEDADRFAEREGFAPIGEKGLLTDYARGEWEKWISDPRHLDRDKYRGWIPPLNIEEKARSGPDQSHDTVCVLGMDGRGRLAGACSTSGMAFKVPGRVGDSPIIGHGLYVDQEAGAAAATGNGELVMGTCGSFLAVEMMRRGAMPIDAATEALTRITKRFKLGPDHQVAMIVMASAKGAGGHGREWGGWASAAIRPGFQHTITDAGGTRVEPAQRVLMA
ncbi:MAG: isoaspartyl peptidase/L-asparaginase [Phycisphaeraceae bacterium]|nr:isoaspartyl peptidase/L-asparaginase [Phycisphaeraceae bacterium]